LLLIDLLQNLVKSNIPHYPTGSIKNFPRPLNMMGLRADDSPADALAPRKERALIANGEACPLECRRLHALAGDQSSVRVIDDFILPRMR
jgi:hypothetical protein